MLNTKVVKVAEEKDGIRVTFEGDVGGEGAAVRPRARWPSAAAQLEGAGLETTRVKVDAKGFIETDPQRAPPSRRSSRSATWRGADARAQGVARGARGRGGDCRS
jgi:hypothetical protein